MTSAKGIRNLICRRLGEGPYKCMGDTEDGRQVQFSADTVDLEKVQGEFSYLLADFRDPVECRSKSGRLECAR
jgi:hypothetical protein